MTESREDRPPDIAGIVRDPRDEIKAIRSLLADVYRDAGDGRTLFRELVQNADDAEARRLTLTVLEDGWRDAQNSLLRGPALLVANDGPFPRKDRNALHKAIGGSKEGDVDKIGTFGIGLKSVFHICEAFLYIGAAQSEWWPGVLNPWNGTGDDGNVDPLYPDWDEVGEEDRERLRAAAKHLLGETNDGLLLWIPLRRNEHDRGAHGRPYWLGDHLGDHLPSPQDLCSWFDCSTPAVLLLAQCGHLRAIDVRRAADPEALGDRVTLMSVARPAETWLGRYGNETSRLPGRRFGGEIESEASKWSVVGIESLDPSSLHDLLSHPDWPQSSATWNGQRGRYETERRKALAHAAVTVLRPVEHNTNPLGMRLRWAVFLPLDDHPEPRPNAIVESEGALPAWEIILHGYFWPSQDRRSIPGVTDQEDGSPGDGGMRDRWNRRLCEELLLPLLPRALAKAVDGVDERTAQGLLERVVCSETLRNRMPHATRLHWLLPVVAQNRVYWRAIDAEKADAGRVLSIPDWAKAPEDVRARFLASCRDDGDAVFIEHAAPRFSGELDDWTIDHIECLLNSTPVDAFASVGSLTWIVGVVGHILGPDSRGEEITAASIVRWLVRRIGEGALAPTVRRSVSEETRKELRETWRGLGEAISREWLVETPVDTRQAVEELTECIGVIGKGLFLLPIGPRPSESRPVINPDNERLDRALTALGERLQVGGESKRIRHSRLLLAETLLSIRPAGPMDDGLRRLPILRAIRFPEDKEEAWSVADLRRQIENRRVFARPPSGTGSRAAVGELAWALGEPVWLVNRGAVASIGADVPIPEPETLAAAVLQTKKFAEPGSRTFLLRRLERNVSEDADVRLAARTLLAGRASGLVRRTKLFQVRGGHQRAVLVLLSLLDRSWCAVDGQLAGSLRQDTLDALSVGQADLEALHRLLDECLSSQVDWAALRDAEALHLLRRLHSTEPESEQRWRTMPLHRDIDGMRGAFDEGAMRSTGRTGEFLLPPEFRADVRLLDPEPEVADLYEAVPALGGDSVLQLMLEDSRPWRFAERIVQQVRSGGGPVSLPRDLDLRRLLRASCWLPDREGGGLAPEAALIAPEEVLDAVSDLAECRVFGDKRLPDAVDPQFWQKAEPVVREILGRMSRARQVERIVDAVDSDRVAQVDDGAWLVMPEPGLVDDLLISWALETTLVGSHPGWKLLHTTKQLLADGDNQLLVRLAESLCAPVPRKRQIEMLKRLAANRPAKDSPSRRMFRRLLGCFARTNDFFEYVLPKLDLPTRDGKWHASRDVARTEIGVARRHRLVSELRPILGLNDDDRLPPPSPIGEDGVGYQSDTLRVYFEPWRNQLPHGAVGAFLSLLGRGLHDGITKLAEEWLGKDVSIEGVRSSLVGRSGEDPCATLNVWVTPHVPRGNRVLAVNLIGERKEMESEPDAKTLFATDPVPRRRSVPDRYRRRVGWLAPPGADWDIQLRDVDPQSRTRSDLLQLLGSTVERWATKYLKLDRKRVNDWWDQWAKRSKADLSPVLASIKAHLPLTLRQLNVGDSKRLRDALREAEMAQRKREQAPPSDQTAIRMERDALDRLADLIKTSEHQDFLWRRVNELMHRYGYRTDGVLLELAQNADDALEQAAEIKGGPLPVRSRRLLVRVQENGVTPTVEVMHWGRRINDTGGEAFPDGRDRQWDQDLYFMMLMNLSSKPGETPGEGSSSATTGRFGLGFKSVHLVSPSPSVFSGFISFSIAGGLLPMEEAIPKDANSWPIEDPRATLVRMPLRTDEHPDEMIESLFGRFSYARALLPVFARQVREVVVEGGPYPGVHVFDGKPIEGAPAWSIGTEVKLPNHQRRWRILRFRPSDAGRQHMGTAALAIGLRGDIPTAFDPDVPFLWNVTPTSENWACGYVVNGPFKLDPGRAHVSLDDNTTLQALDALGHELGRGLIELHDLVTGSTEAAHCSGLPLESDGQSFLSSLWEVLASGADNPDTLRRKFLLRLHGSGHGISAWMAVRSVVPTNLPPPFPPLLPPLSSRMSWEVATGGLEHPDLCAALAEIEDEEFRSLVRSRCIVSPKTDKLLAPLRELPGGLDGSATVSPWDVLADLADKWDYLLTPTRLHSLRPLSRAAAWDLVSNDPHGATWRRRFRARSAAGSSQPLPSLQVHHASPLQDESDGDLEDELLRSRFAPSNRVLDPSYIGCPEDWIVFRWLRAEHHVDTAEISRWYGDVEEDLRPAALRYLMDGRLRNPVLHRLVSLETRPPWLRDFDAVRRMLERVCEKQWRRQQLLGAFFPEQVSEHVSSPRSGPPSTNFFHQLSDWWDDSDVRTEVTTAYERRAWPEWLRRDGDISDRLQTESEDHWLALLILGACQRLGRKRNRHHRRFLELVHDHGYWSVFKTSDDSGAWMRMLREWQDAELAYSEWMSLFPAIYQLSRYRDSYAGLLKSAGQRPSTMYNITVLLAPREDPAMTGAGTRFDAPRAPLDMGLHWVLRELVRLEVVEDEHLYPDCWMPSEQVLSFLHRFGLQLPEDKMSNPEKARAIFDFMASRLGTKTPNLHRAFDIPIRHVASTSDLRRRFGLEW